MKDLRSSLWDAQRFALLPPKLIRRLTNRSEPRVLVISLPKAGTHLLERALILNTPLYRKWLPTLNEENLENHGGFAGILARLQPGQILVSHLPFKPAWRETILQAEVRTVLIKRDPRDIAVSNMFYIKKRTDHRLHRAIMEQPSDRDRFRLLIQGDIPNSIRGIGEVLKRFSGWLDTVDVVTSYEALIGPQGGGSKRSQLELIREMLANLGMEVSEQAIERTGDLLFSSASPTYRKGLIGQWREHLDGDLLDDFMKVAGDLARDYGYRLNS